MRLSQLGLLAFDPLRDLNLLARTSGQTFGIVVKADSPWNNLHELMAAARAKSGRLTYGSAGLAGATHVGMEELLMMANARMQHLPYKGRAPALADLLGGRTDVLADSSSWARDVRQGRLRVLATWGELRIPAFAQAPTLKELGYDMVVDAPNGIGAPAGLSPSVEAVLRGAVRAAIQSAEFRQACERIDAPVMYQEAAAYRRYMLTQYEKEKLLIKKLNLRKQLDKQAGP